MGGHSDGEGLQGTCRGVYDLQTFGSDEAMLPTRGIDWFDGGLWQEMYKHSWNPGNEIVGNAWKFASANSAHSITGLMPLTKSDGYTTIYPIPRNVNTLNPHILQNKRY